MSISQSEKKCGFLSWIFLFLNLCVCMCWVAMLFITVAFSKTKLTESEKLLCLKMEKIEEINVGEKTHLTETKRWKQVEGHSSSGRQSLLNDRGKTGEIKRVEERG